MVFVVVVVVDVVASYFSLHEGIELESNRIESNRIESNRIETLFIHGIISLKSGLLKSRAH